MLKIGMYYEVLEDTEGLLLLRDIGTGDKEIAMGVITLVTPDEFRITYNKKIFRFPVGFRVAVACDDPVVLSIPSDAKLQPTYKKDRERFYAIATEAFNRFSRVLDSRELRHLYSIPDLVNQTSAQDLIFKITESFDRLSWSSCSEKEICCSVMSILYGEDICDFCMAMISNNNTRLRFRVDDPPILYVNDMDVRIMYDRVRRLCDQCETDPFRRAINSMNGD